MPWKPVAGDWLTKDVRNHGFVSRPRSSRTPRAAVPIPGICSSQETQRLSSWSFWLCPGPRAVDADGAIAFFEKRTPFKKNAMTKFKSWQYAKLPIRQTDVVLLSSARNRSRLARIQRFLAKQQATHRMSWPSSPHSQHKPAKRGVELFEHNRRQPVQPCRKKVTTVTTA